MVPPPGVNVILQCCHIISTHSPPDPDEDGDVVTGDRVDGDVEEDVGDKDVVEPVILIYLGIAVPHYIVAPLLTHNIVFHDQFQVMI